MKYDIVSFLAESKTYPIIDVRTPAEYTQGHIPSAINIPIFTNEERAVVGTIYKKIGKEKAIMEGLKIVGPKMYKYVEDAKKFAVDNKVLVHCWRGGMRSASMAWLFNTAGIDANTLEGGYKAYRTHIRQSFLRPQKINILGGMTGSNKTTILHEMHRMGQQFIDLEGLALHRGSSYGQIGLAPQPTNEQFENNIAAEWLSLKQDEILWLEDESKGMGSVRIVDELYERIRQSDLYILMKSKELRIKHLLDDYADLDKNELKKALERIKKRLGGNNLKDALEALEINDYRTVVDLSLTYYDKAYKYGIEIRPNVKKVIIETDEYDAKNNAQLVLKAAGLIN